MLSCPPTLLDRFASYLLGAYPRQELERAAAQARPILPLEAWAARYLKTDAGSPLAPANRFHAWLCERLDRLRAERGKRVNVLAPRGAAKSTWSTFAWPLWCALHALEPYIVITADTGEQARKYLDALREELEGNELLAQDYPHLAGQGPVWRADRIKMANGVMVEALGTGTKLRGRRKRAHRPSLIIVDDPQNLEHIISPVQRQRSWEWLTKDVSNAGSPSTNIVVLGTALHREAIVCQLQTTPGWESHVFKAIIEWPERMDLWGEWEAILHDWDDPAREAKARAFYLRHVKEMNQ